MEKTRDVLTTGQVARICQVAPRTVSKWVDTGQLRGYRIPGSKDRRIPIRHLIRFLKAHGMPLNGLDSGGTRLLIVDADLELTALLRSALEQNEAYTVRLADSALEAGAQVESFAPHVILVDIDLPGVDGRTLTQFLASRAELREVTLVATSASLSPVDRQMLLQSGFRAALAKPFTIPELIEVLDGQTAAKV